MTRVMDKEQNHTGRHTPLTRQIASGSRPWLDLLRRQSADRFQATGFPTSRHEEWRHTNVSALARTSFLHAERRGDVTPSVLDPYSFAAESAAELVFVNGFFEPALSSSRAVLRQARVLSFEQAAGSIDGVLEQYLGHASQADANPFGLLNTSRFRDGAVVVVPRGCVLEDPIHLVFLSAPGQTPVEVHPRVLIVAEEQSQVSVVETHAAVGEGVYFSNPVTELFVAAGARVEHCKVQQESLTAFHIGATHANVARGGYLLSHVASLGASLSRNDLNVVLAGAGAEAMLNGITLIAGNQHVDNHTLLDHSEPNCPSHELYKAVLDGQSSGVFKGKILVRPGAQRTDSKQSSRTLLLSDRAVMHSQPALEIYADDVKCTHGSTIGPVDEQQIFYLRSRGVSQEAARHLLTYAFLAEVTGRIGVSPVRQRLESIMAARHGLPQDLRVADLDLDG